MNRGGSRACWLRRVRTANFEVTPVVTARETCRSAARPRAGPPLRTEQDFSGLPAPRELGQDSPAPDRAFKIGLASQPLHLRIGHCAKARTFSKTLAQPGTTEPSVVPSCTGSAGQPGSLAGSQLQVRVFPGCVLELPVPSLVAEHVTSFPPLPSLHPSQAWILLPCTPRMDYSPLPRPGTASDAAH
jgi:hypothetical protein